MAVAAGHPVPVLDAGPIQAAIAEARFDDAESLLAVHLDAVAAALAAGIDRADAGTWLALLQAQRALADQCRTGRDTARDALDRAHGDRRGVIAWQKALA